MKITVTIELETQADLADLLVKLNGNVPVATAPTNAAPAVVATVVSTGTETLTHDMVRPLLSKKLEEGHNAVIAAEFKKYKVKSLSPLPAEHLPAFQAFLNSLGQ